MSSLKIMSVFGTRPEAIKMAPVVCALEKCGHVQSVVCVTAQHREMLDQAMAPFGIRADYDLNIMKDRQTVLDITTAALAGVLKVIDEERPNMVLVHGDTTTTFAAALAAFYTKTSIGHVEAGLRTGDKYQPFPEELNRVMVARLADVHFAPTQTSKQNLLKENIESGHVFVTGNTALDCLRTTVKENYQFNNQTLNRVDFKNRRVIAMTAHRRENLGRPLENICRAALEIVEENADIELVYAAHKNPAVWNTAQSLLGGQPRIHITEPLDMEDMHNLLNRCYLVMTDSGGLQEEAPGLNKPVLVLRNVTERPEGLEAGTLILCGTDTDQVAHCTNKLLNDKDAYTRMASAKNPFGDGCASERIVRCLLYYFGVEKDRPEDFATL